MKSDGGWWESDNVFAVHREEIGDSRPREEQISATFDEDRVKLEIQNASGVLTLAGRIDE